MRGPRAIELTGGPWATFDQAEAARTPALMLNLLLAARRSAVREVDDSILAARDHWAVRQDNAIGRKERYRRRSVRSFSCSCSCDCNEMTTKGDSLGGLRVWGTRTFAETNTRATLAYEGIGAHARAPLP